MFEWIVSNLKVVLIFTAGVVFTVIVTRYKEGIKKGTNFVIDSILSWVRIYFLIMKRYKKSIIRSYRETKVGYRNLRLDLDRNYISLKVQSFVHYKQKDVDEEIRSEKLDVLEVMKKHRHLVILGGPGAGKTTLMQWLLLKYAYGQMKEELGEKLIPIFIALRSLESGQSVDDLLVEVLKQNHFKKGDGFIRKQMGKGKCLIIFDGMDEILDYTTRKKFIDDIKKYDSLYEKSRILLTSRIEEYPLNPFPNSFWEHEILDLNMEQVKDFVNGILKTEDNPEGLIRQINNILGLKTLATTPLMLSFLTFIYQENNQKLPNERVKIYDLCMQYMLKDRDERYGIYEYRNKFDPDDKELLFSKMAYDFSLTNKWRFTEKELLEQWNKNIPPNLDPNDLKKFLNEVCKANGIMKHLSRNELSFLHRTFQEYYAAKEVSKKGQDFFEKEEDSIFEQLSKKEWCEITLFLVGMMDDASLLIQKICLKNPQVAFECLAHAKLVEDIVINDVICTVLTVLDENIILNACNNMSFLANRYGLNRICRYFSNALKKIEKDDDKKYLWQVIDHVMLAFSPQKGMIYVSSGAAGWGRRPREWIPGFWMDIYPVTNSGYQVWIELSKIMELPRHWEIKSDEELLVTGMMKLLPIVDVNYNNASAYSSHLNRRLPGIKEWSNAGKRENNTGGWGLLNENKLNYLTKSDLKKSFYYYRSFYHGIDITRKLAFDLDRARRLAFDLDHAFDRVRKLEFDLDGANNLDDDIDNFFRRAGDLTSELSLADDLSVDFARTLGHAFARASGIARTRARDHDFALERDLAVKSLEFSKAGDIALQRARELDPINNLARDLASDLSSLRSFAINPNFKFKKLVPYLDFASKAQNVIKKKLKYSWTSEVWEKTFELGKAMLDALVVFLEILIEDVPEDLLRALRQPGLLIPVNEFPPNNLGICGLIGNVWEWTSTKNEKGEHLICGGAWTEEKYDPDKEEWRPPDWRDINLGFRCVCDWDKIGEVKEPEGEVEVKAEVERED